MARSRHRDDYDDEYDEDEYDDEDERPRRRSSAESGGNTAVKILAIIGAVVLGIVLVCGGLAFYAFRSAQQGLDQMQVEVAARQEQMRREQQERERKEANSDNGRSEQFANAFLQEVKGNRADPAYRMTTAAFKARVSQDAFKTLVQKSAGPLNLSLPVSADLFAPEAGAVYSFHGPVMDNRRVLNLSLTVVKEGNDWKVDQFALD
jgi:hypothetical protein